MLKNARSIIGGLSSDLLERIWDYRGFDNLILTWRTKRQFSDCKISFSRITYFCCRFWTTLYFEIIFSARVILKIKIIIEIFVKNWNFGEKLKFWSKIEILVKNWNLCQKIEILVKNWKFGQKLKFQPKLKSCSKTEIWVRKLKL